MTGLQLAQQLAQMAHDPGTLAQLSAGRSLLQQQGNNAAVAAPGTGLDQQSPMEAAGEVGAAANTADAADEDAAAASAAAGTAAGAAAGTAAGSDEPLAKKARLEQQDPPPDLEPGEEPDEDEDGGGGFGGGGGARSGSGPRPPSARDHRLRQRRWWALKRRFADLTAQVEAAVCEVG
jgi:hypothetical protein